MRARPMAMTMYRLYTDGNKSLDSPRTPWETPDRRWNLLAMLRLGVWPLVNYTHELTLLSEDLKTRRRADQASPVSSSGELTTRGAFASQDRQNFRLLVDSFGPWLKALGLTASLDRLDRLSRILGPEHEDDEFGRSDEVLHNVEVFLQILEDELKRHEFIYLTPAEARQYDDPLAPFAKTLKAFPSAAADIADASRCGALGQATACVVHCMGILQSGLYALASDLGVTFPWSIELENWKNIIDQVEKRIATLGSGAKSTEKDQRLKFYSEAASQFRYFKDAWRNHVCHLRERYDAHQATSIFLHVTDFMETLSARLTEPSVKEV